jgi:hypothetical protein
MSAKILYQLQLSNYDAKGQFILTADSNWQIFVTKMLEMVKVDPDILVYVLTPNAMDCLESPGTLLMDLGLLNNVKVIQLPIAANALRTRYDFPWEVITTKLEIELRNDLEKITHVYVNDPLLFANYRAFFYLKKLKPRFILQTHFLDSPVARVVDPEISYWYGTVGACDKSDVFLWHCISMQNVFRKALSMEFKPKVVDRLMQKSDVWKDGYSIAEIRKPIDEKNIRFDRSQLEGKNVVWVPNRIGGLGRSFDYTNNGKFMFEIVPKLWKKRQDFVIVAGNPNQKISNDDLVKHCPAYLKLVDGALNRDEYRWLSQRADIVVGLYTNDTNGGLASLESIEFNALPLFPDVYEYKVYFDAVNWPTEHRIKPNLSNAHVVLSNTLDVLGGNGLENERKNMQKFIRTYAAYEHTTLQAMKKLGFV